MSFNFREIFDKKIKTKIIIKFRKYIEINYNF